MAPIDLPNAALPPLKLLKKKKMQFLRSTINQSPIKQGIPVQVFSWLSIPLGISVSTIR